MTEPKDTAESIATPTARKLAAWPDLLRLLVICRGQLVLGEGHGALIAEINAVLTKAVDPIDLDRDGATAESTATHTPGPWWFVLGCQGRIAYVMTETVGGIAMIDENPIGNARLIAAAPDLLDDAKLSATFYEWLSDKISVIEKGRGDNTVDTAGAMRAIHLMIRTRYTGTRTAIAKATGGAA